MQAFFNLAGDYLYYTRLLNKANYNAIYHQTLDAFSALIEWAKHSQDVIWSSKSELMKKLPCRNDAYLEKQKEKWSKLFVETNIDPIQHLSDAFQNC